MSAVEIAIAVGATIVVFAAMFLLIVRSSNRRLDEATVSALSAILTYAKDFRAMSLRDQHVSIDKIVDASGVAGEASEASEKGRSKPTETRRTTGSFSWSESFRC